MSETAKKTTKKTTQKTYDEDYYNELVTVRLFKDNAKYKDDVFVAVNGKGMIVPRGVDVKIPRKYAEALKNSEVQDSLAAEYAAGLSKQADAEALK